MSRAQSRRTVRKRGHAVMEVAFLAPWIFFLFSGALDAGFYEVALISAQNGAREAAQFTSKNTTNASDSTSACQYVLDEMKTLSNVKNLSSCGAAPLVVTATSKTGVDGSPASEVSVTYTSDLLIPIPGLMRQMVVTRVVQMRIR